MHLRARVTRFFFNRCGSTDLEGFDVRCLPGPTDERARALARLADALALLRDKAPLHLQYLRRDLPRLFLVDTGPSAAECHYPVGLCSLNVANISKDWVSPSEVALVLVHEGMHARLARRGFVYAGDARSRIESICHAAEAFVATRLPGADALAASIAESLARVPYRYSDRGFRRRELREAAALGSMARPVLALGRLLDWCLHRRAGVPSN